MIDTQLMKEIRDEIEQSQTTLAALALVKGIKVIPSEALQPGESALLVAPDVYEKLKEKSATEVAL